MKVGDTVRFAAANGSLGVIEQKSFGDSWYVRWHYGLDASLQPWTALSNVREHELLPIDRSLFERHKALRAFSKEQRDLLKEPAMSLPKFFSWLNDYWDAHQANDARDIAIPALGLVGESTEVEELMPECHLSRFTARTSEFFKKAIRDGKNIHRHPELGLELGDSLHYLCRLIHLAGYKPEEIMQMNVDKLEARRAEKAKLKTALTTRSFAEFREALAPLNSSPEHTLDAPIEVGDSPNGNGGW